MTDKEICDVLDAIAKALPHEPGPSVYVWADDDQFLCKTEAAANSIADLIDSMYGESVCCTGYYDPAEDERNGEVNQYTGWHYVIVL